jgi:hypothetical protein
MTSPGKRGEEAEILSTVPYDILDSFQGIKPDKILRKGHLTVLKKKRSYILITQSISAIFFVRMFAETLSYKQNLHLPILFIGDTQFNYRIAGLPLAKIRGEIVIPVDVVIGADGKREARYSMGYGVEYVFPTEYVRTGEEYPLDLSKRYDAATLLKILNELEEESDNPQ